MPRPQAPVLLRSVDDVGPGGDEAKTFVRLATQCCEGHPSSAFRISATGEVRTDDRPGRETVRGLQGHLGVAAHPGEPQTQRSLSYLEVFRPQGMEP